MRAHTMLPAAFALALTAAACGPDDPLRDPRIVVHEAFESKIDRIMPARTRDGRALRLAGFAAAACGRLRRDLVASADARCEALRVGRVGLRPGDPAGFDSRVVEVSWTLAKSLAVIAGRSALDVAANANEARGLFDLELLFFGGERAAAFLTLRSEVAAVDSGDVAGGWFDRYLSRLPDGTTLLGGGQ